MFTFLNEPGSAKRIAGKLNRSQSVPAYAVQDESSPDSLERYGVQSGFQSIGTVKRFAPPWLVSFVAHAILLCLIALITFSETRQELVELTVSELEEIELELSPTIRSSQASSQAQQADEERTAADLPTHASLIAESRQAFFIQELDIQPFKVSRTSGGQSANALARIKHEFNTTISPDNTTGQDNGDQQADFFGIQADGKRFVFVIDSSTSMRGSKWVRACRELWTTLAELRDDQEFCVLFFDLETHLMFSRPPAKLETIPATAMNLKRVKRWASTVHLGPETLPMASLRVAIDIKPDAIFLLSDGEIHDRSQLFLLDQNGSRGKEAAIPVNTIAFVSEIGARALKEIADENFGQFRFVR